MLLCEFGASLLLKFPKKFGKWIVTKPAKEKRSLWAAAANWPNSPYLINKNQQDPTSTFCACLVRIKQFFLGILRFLSFLWFLLLLQHVNHDHQARHGVNKTHNVIIVIAFNTSLVPQKADSQKKAHFNSTCTSICQPVTSKETNSITTAIVNHSADLALPYGMGSSVHT